MTSECPICTERFNKTIHVPVTCNFCSFWACKACCIRVLEQSYTDPACMSCKKPWCMDFMTYAFGKTFMNSKLKVLRENVLFEREKGLMPATQAYVEQILEDKKLKATIEDLTQKRLTMKKDLNNSDLSEQERLGTFLKMSQIHAVVDRLKLMREGNQMMDKTVMKRHTHSRNCKNPTSMIKLQNE